MKINKKGGILTLALIFLLIVILAVSGYYVYLNFFGINAAPRSFILNAQKTKNYENVTSYSGKFQFYPNMRFPNTKISYWIEDSCGEQKKSRMIQAFAYLENRTQILSFFPASLNEAQILASCQETEEEITGKGHYFIAGEGGPAFVNTSLFYVIEQGRILLYRDSKCDDFNVELHELLHVFGFDHSASKESIMHNFSYCDQVLTNDIIQEIKEMYSVPELPDLYIEKVTASKHGSYIDFNITIKNRGLKIAENSALELYSGSDKIYSYNLGNIDYGEGRFLEADNVKAGRSISEIQFVISGGQELYSENNKVNLILEQ